MQKEDPIMVEEDPFTFRETDDAQKTASIKMEEKTLSHRALRNSMTEQTQERKYGTARMSKQEPTKFINI